MTTPRRASAGALTKLALFDRREGLTRTGDSILLAVSGGPDSVCLAHYLLGLARKKRLRLALFHLNHGLRGAQARADARFVERLAKRLQLPCFSAAADARARARRRRGGLEEAARALRYGALARLARREGFAKVATGHHLDDQAETLLLHILRGTRLKGLAGIPPKRRLCADVDLIRPLLALSRKEIRGYLAAHKLAFRRDRMNADEAFTRNWVRRRALPLLEARGPRVREHLAALAGQVRKLAPGI